MEEHLKWLGWRVKDKVTGLTGVVTHIGVDLYGCLQAIVQPPAAQEQNGAQKLEGSGWFDVARLELSGDGPVMEPIPLKGVVLVAGADNYKPTK